MKTQLSTRLVLSIVAACLLGAFSVAPLSGCSFLSKTESALTGTSAVVTLEIVGATTDLFMQDAAKLEVAGKITPAQWAGISSDYAKEQTLFHSAVANVTAANSPAPANVVAAMSAIVADFKAF